MAHRKRGRRRVRTPGAYVEEVPSGARPIEGVGTSTAGFVGFAQRHPVLTGAVVLAVGLVVAAVAVSSTRRTASILG